MKRLILGLGLVALAVVTAACSGASAAPATADPASAPSGDAITIVAKGMQFTTPNVTVPAGQPVSIVLDNQEGAPHNIAIKDASGAEVFKGEIVTNAKVTNAVPALAAGTYQFYCQVHPDMKGTITAQ